MAAVAVLGLDELVLWLVGADAAHAHINAGMIAGITGACAIAVGWGILPGASYLWSRLTYNGRTALSELQAVRREIAGLLITRADTSQETLRASALQVKTELEASKRRLDDTLESGCYWGRVPFPTEQWELHQTVLTARRELYEKLSKAEVEIHTLNTMSFYPHRAVQSSPILAKIGKARDCLKEAIDAIAATDF